MLIKLLQELFSNSAKHDTEPSNETGRIYNRSLNKALYNFEIVDILNTEYGIKLRSVFQLNKIMEKMGLIEKTGRGWLLTEYGRVKYTGCKGLVYNPNFWNRDIVSAIADYIKNNHIEVSEINRKW